MITEVYDALLNAGAEESKARKAAEVLANYEDRFAKVDVRMERFEGKLTLAQWQLAVLIAGVAAFVIRAFA
jgi:hypothetical protein